MNNILLYIIQVSSVFSALYILYVLILSRLTFHKINRFVLLLLIPVSVILPFSDHLIPSSLSSKIIDNPLIESVLFDTSNFDLTTIKPIVNKELVNVNTTIRTSSFNSINVLVCIYWLVVSIYLIRVLITTRKLYVLKSKSIIQQKKGYQLITANVKEIFSYFNWIFIPAAEFDSYDEQIIAHEKVHIRLKHSWDVIVTEVYIAFFWFNPLLYFYRTSLKSVHEFQADNGVLKNGVKTSEYMTLLRQSLEVKSPNNLYSYFNQPILKKRVIMMTKPKSNRISKLKYVVLLAVSAFLILAFTSPIIENNEFLNSLEVSEYSSSTPSLFPVQYATKENITAYFGEKGKYSKVNKNVSHTGIDIRAAIGTPVFATADGTILKASINGDWGNLIIISHTDGFETWYAHLNGFNINENQDVKKGAIIGYVGSTGKSTGPHLHYEVKQNGKQLNPLDYISNPTKTIVIDVSHGGYDNGTRLNEHNEKEITLSIAEKIKARNKNANINIVLTRDSDQFISLNERTAYINKLKPDFVISLHVNSSNDANRNGTELFISNKNKQYQKSLKLATALSNSFAKRHVEIKKTNLQLLKNVNYPIALIELGYLSNKKDMELLTSENGQLTLVNSILNVLK